ncbi:hypothetical protein GZH46_00582 [Fragariocoptes setiger]|uniref:Uncharacterized protein n=1 Tax=Fragariocoptes setiger TaxID=1670756 RepID=A0ABQ7SBV9_9ACAR|nr:hypothetical protein GZH46_00582 [Fragariocoptes setiger]
MSATLQVLNVSLNHTILGEFNCPPLLYTNQSVLNNNSNGSNGHPVIASELSSETHAKLNAIHGIWHVIDALNQSANQTSNVSCPPELGRADKYCCGYGNIRYCCIPPPTQGDGNVIGNARIDDTMVGSRQLTVGDGIDDLDNLMLVQTNPTTTDNNDAVSWSQVITSALDSVFTSVSTTNTTVTNGTSLDSNQSGTNDHRNIDHKRRLGTATLSSESQQMNDDELSSFIYVRPRTLMRLSMMITLSSCYVCRRYMKRRLSCIIPINQQRINDHYCDRSGGSQHCESNYECDQYNSMFEIPHQFTNRSWQAMLRRYRSTHMVADTTCHTSQSLTISQLDPHSLNTIEHAIGSDSGTATANSDANDECMRLSSESARQCDNQLLQANAEPRSSPHTVMPVHVSGGANNDNSTTARLHVDNNHRVSENMLNSSTDLPIYSRHNGVNVSPASPLSPTTINGMANLDSSTMHGHSFPGIVNDCPRNMSESHRQQDGELKRLPHTTTRTTFITSPPYARLLSAYDLLRMSKSSETPIIIATSPASANNVLRRLEQIANDSQPRQQQLSSTPQIRHTELASTMPSTSGSSSELDDPSFCLLTPSSLAISPIMTTVAVTSEANSSLFSEPPPPYTIGENVISCDPGTPNNQSATRSIQSPPMQLEDSGCASSCDDQVTD